MNDKLKTQWNNLKTKAAENPVIAVGVITSLVPAITSGVSQLVRANAERQNAKSWKKEVNRRIDADRMKHYRR